MVLYRWFFSRSRVYLYESSTCRYVRLNALNVLYVHGPCFNAPLLVNFAKLSSKLFKIEIEVCKASNKIVKGDIYSRLSRLVPLRLRLVNIDSKKISKKPNCVDTNCYKTIHCKYVISGKPTKLTKLCMELPLCTRLTSSKL